MNGKSGKMNDPPLTSISRVLLSLTPTLCLASCIVRWDPLNRVGVSPGSKRARKILANVSDMFNAFLAISSRYQDKKKKKSSGFRYLKLIYLNLWFNQRQILPVISAGRTITPQLASPATSHALSEWTFGARLHIIFRLTDACCYYLTITNTKIIFKFFLPFSYESLNIIAKNGTIALEWIATSPIEDARYVLNVKCTRRT